MFKKACSSKAHLGSKKPEAQPVAPCKGSSPAHPLSPLKLSSLQTEAPSDPSPQFPEKGHGGERRARTPLSNPVRRTCMANTSLLLTPRAVRSTSLYRRIRSFCRERARRKMKHETRYTYAYTESHDKALIRLE